VRIKLGQTHRNLSALASSGTQRGTPEYGASPRRRVTTDVTEISPALGPSAMTAAQTEQRPGTGAPRGGFQPATPVQSPAHRIDKGTVTPPSGHTKGMPERPSTGGSCDGQPAIPHRPSTAWVKSRSPKDDVLPVRPATADAITSTLLPPATTTTPEALVGNAVDAQATKEESPNGVMLTHPTVHVFVRFSYRTKTHMASGATCSVTVAWACLGANDASQDSAL
jgi:hypothetical protein